MADLKSTTAIVKAILEVDERARNSDSHLYMKVLELHGETTGIHYLRFPVSAFLEHMGKWGVPPFESVRRARQKVQASFPELASNRRVAQLRAENEEIYREYARGDI